MAFSIAPLATQTTLKTTSCMFVAEKPCKGSFNKIINVCMYVCGNSMHYILWLLQKDSLKCGAIIIIMKLFFVLRSESHLNRYLHL